MNYFQLRRLAIRMSNAVRGFIRTVTGTPPITLESCVDDKSVINYQLYGNSVQDGEPSPENPVEVASFGEYDEETGKYKIPITANGKNLFNENSLSGGYGVEDYNGVRCYKFRDGASGNFVITADFKEKTNYYVTLTIHSSDSSKLINLRVYYTDGTYKVLIVNASKLGTPYKFSTSSSSKTVAYITSYNSYNITRYLDLTNLQIEEGTMATDYEPYVQPITTNIYLNEPLRADTSGNYADYIDGEKKKVVRQIYNEYITKVNSASSMSSIYKRFLTSITHKPYTYQKNNNSSTNYTCGFCLSNKFIKHDGTYGGIGSVGGYIQTYITLGGGNRICYTFSDETVTTVEQAQEIIGEGFDIYYILETPIEEDIELPELPTFKGKNVTYTIDTTIQPSNMAVTYYSSKKGE